MRTSNNISKSLKKPNRTSIGDYVGEISLGFTIPGRVASLRLHPQNPSKNRSASGEHYRALNELEVSGASTLNKLSDIMSRNRLYLQMFATILLSVGVLTALIPAVALGAYEKNSTPWHLTISLIICLTAFAFFLITELANMSLWRIRSPRLLRMIGIFSLGVTKAHPSMVHAGSLYGVLARRSLRRSKLDPYAQETFYSMIGEWEGTAEELYRFARSLEN